MSEYTGKDLILHKVGTGELDIYNVWAAPLTGEVEASIELDRLYDVAAQDTGRHPDDDFEQILSTIAEWLSKDYP